MTSLTARDRQTELMDDPDLDPGLHQQALIGLRRVHWVSGTVSTIWKPIHQLAQQTPGTKLRVLDVACGGGDLTVALAARAKRSGHSVEISGCDISSTALNFAAAHAAAKRVDVHFFSADVLSAPLPQEYDVVCCSLFLHHLDETDAVKLLASMRNAAKRMVLISDLCRSRLGYILAWSGLRLLTRSRICHVDGPLSVRAAFTPSEILDLAARAQLSNSTLTRLWPERFLLKWSRE
ncbi:MAG: methyltransferase domain-containing protein [Fuerstiella sp.]